MHTMVSVFGAVFASERYPFKNIFYEPYCVACDEWLTHRDNDLPRTGGGLQAKHLLPCCSIREILLIEMQHDHVTKKLIFNPTPRVVEGGRGVGGLRAKYLLHVASFLIAINLICNMTLF